ncbi:protein kinase STUNTED-like isoform X2 [Tasmannia lanceolata]|uniref:protein kinase STUNTED-like isoform X2 n=1 Tax=Tasmannia lanceolata TaxID=3420 RepID=UPI0040636CA7
MMGNVEPGRVSFPQSCMGTMAIVKKKKPRTMVVGLKSHNCSREMLLRVLITLVVKGDTVVALHVQESEDRFLFDPNSFHIYEDLCKSKQVNFHVKLSGEGTAPLAAILAHQVQIHSASTLVLGSSRPWPKDWIVTTCLNGLPPTCTLLVMDEAGRILFEEPGTFRKGLAAIQAPPPFCSSSPSSTFKRLEPNHHSLKPSLMPSITTSPRRYDVNTVPKAVQLHDGKEEFHHLQRLEAKGATTQFTHQELASATNNFSPLMMIGEGGHSRVFRANLSGGRVAAVKLLKISQWSGKELLMEVEILSELKHKHIIQLIGYCYSKNMQAVVYSLLEGSLGQNLACLGWRDRVRVAIGVAKALDYLHHACSPPIIHRDVKSSNILLSHHYQPQLSDFGSAMLHYQTKQAPENKNFHNVVGTFGYLAPEYVMYGEVDEKTDVYSFGVVLLELITGKEAIKINSESCCESLVLWARSLLSAGLCEQLIDPSLNDTYDREEMQKMMVAAGLCILHSSSTRPTMNKILKLLEEPEHLAKLQREKEEVGNEIGSEGETNSIPITEEDIADSLSSLESSELDVMKSIAH